VANRPRRGARLVVAIQSALLAAASIALVPVTPVAAAVGNSALTLNGTSQYASVGTSTSLRSSVFTLELWFKRAVGGATQSTGTGGVDVYPLITKGRAEGETATADVNYFLGINVTGHLAADFEEAQTGASPSLNHPITGAGIVLATDTGWHHAAATYDGSIWNLYLDGSLDGTLAVNRPANIASTAVTAIGSSLNTVAPITAAGFFSGTIDEVRIWNTARSQAQIQATRNTEIIAPATGLMGGWNLNEGTGTNLGDSSGNVVTGTAVGSPTWAASGFAAAGNSALGLNGTSQYASVGTSTALRTSAFTLELWFKRAAGGATQSTGTGGVVAYPLITKGRAEAETAAADVNYFFGIDANGHLAADFEEAQTGAAPSANHPILGAGTVLATDTGWHHAAATYDGTTWNLYLDGALDGTLAVNRPANIASTVVTAIGTSLNAGTAPTGPLGFFSGTIDEVRIWNAARSQAQIQAAKNTEITSPASGLIGAWNLNEGTGTNLGDSSGNVVTGTAVAGPAWLSGFVPPVIDTTPPAAPQNLAATATAGTGVSLTWTANSESDLAGYNVYRSTLSPVSTAGTPLNASILVSPSYTDSNIAAGSTYYYRVVAVDTSANKSAGSNEVSSGLTGNYALELWLKRAAGGATQSTGTGGVVAYPLITKGRAEAETAAADVNYFLGIDAAGHLTADFEEAQSGTNPSLNHPMTGGTVIPVDGTWHHAAATYDGTTWRLYLDGDPDGTLAVGQPANNASTVVTAIGSSLNAGTAPTGPAGFFSGTIDEVRIWNNARTQAQIQAAKNTEITAPASGLIGAWNLNDGIGSALADSSGNAVAATAVAAPTWVAGFVPPATNLAPTVSLVGPSDGATGQSTSPSLAVTATDPEGSALSVTFFGRAYGSGTFVSIATVSGVASGTTAATVWSGRADGQRYEWYATVSDGTKTATGPTWTFDTTAGADPVLVGGGDIAICPDGSTNTGFLTSSILEGVAGDIFTAGDNVYLDGTATEFATCYDPSWGGAPSHDLKARTHPAAGNHDWNTANLAGYLGYFNASSSYYSYDLGPAWHVAVLDSECAKVTGGCGATSAQVTWFRSDLAANTDRNVIVVWHKPRFSSGATTATETQPFWDVAYQYGVDLILVGHDHVYERMAPMNAAGAADPLNGIRQITVGTGGEGHHTFGTTEPASLVRNADTFGVLKLTLHPTSYDWVFLPEDGKTFTDSGSAPVNAGPNHAPVISSVTISPTSPTTAQTLTATVTASDPDSDPLTYAYQWTKNGTNIVGATASTLNLATAGNGDRGDVIRVRVTASDGVATTAPLTASPVTVVNSLPTVSVSLAPASPTTNQTLTATAIKADADGDSVSLTYVWTVGGVTKKTTTSSSSLTDTFNLSVAGNGDKGQAITATVTPTDPTSTGTDASASATVANSPPTLASASITETSATTTTLLHATAGATADADGDPVSNAYQWTKNGTDIAGATASTLDLSIAGNGDRGDVIRVRITPSDGIASGTGVTSGPLTIGNTAPVATVILGDHTPQTNDTLTATATRSDADADTSTLSYVWRVNGVVKKTTAATSALADSLNLATAGNGDAGDTVSVQVTPFDGTTSGTAVTDTATVLADTTPPAAPAGATFAATSRSIDLDWADNAEPDLAGYRVYRAASASGPFSLVTGSLLTASAYTDSAPVVGSIYYRLVAVDTSGNASGPGLIDGVRGIAFRSSSSATGTGSSLAIAKPAGTVNGDVLVAGIETLGTATLTPPSGWTLVKTDSSGSALRQAVLVHLAGSEPGPYVFSFSASQGSAGVISGYIGVDGATPVDVSAGQVNPSSTAITSPSVTTTVGTLLITVSGLATNATIAPASGLTEQAEVLLSSGKSKAAIELADVLRPTIGGTGAKAATASKSAVNIGQTVALRVSGATPPPPPDLVAPSAPLNLSAAAGSAKVTLTWAHPTSDGGTAIINYVVYRGPTAGGEIVLTTVGDVTSFQDLTVTNGTTYFYKVAAVNSVGEGPKSNESSATPAATAAPSAPRNLSAGQAKPRGIALSWTVPASNGGSAITGYQILRGTSSGGEAFLTNVGNVTSYKDTTAARGVTYWYTVVAINAIGSSPASNEASATAR
jgi:fibronectin type 3 domain-containing protein